MLDSDDLEKFEFEADTSVRGQLDGDYFVPAAITDPGCERELNEDRYAAIESKFGLVWLVCDGMGGVNGGELAAQLVIDSVRRFMDILKPNRPEILFKQALSEANRVVVLRRQNQAFAQMGTTAVGAIFQDRQVSIINVGDSRAYLVSKSSIKQLTEDHTYVQQLVKAGQISHEEAMEHPQAHVLTRAIGSDANLELDMVNYWIWDIEDQDQQDFLVFCTDGLYSMLEDEEIQKIVLENNPQASCSKLVNLAKERGGYDNITISVVPLVGKLKKAPPVGYELKAIELEEEASSFGNIKAFIIKNTLMIIGISIIALIVAIVSTLLLVSR